MYNHAPKEYICPFCLIVKGIFNEHVRSQVEDIVYQDQLVTALIGANTWKNNNGNVVIIPNEHWENIYDLPLNINSEIQRVAKLMALAMKKEYSCEGISTRQHNEPAGDQEIWHYHLHVFPRYKNDQLYLSPRIIALPEQRIVYANKLKKFLSENKLF